MAEKTRQYIFSEGQIRTMFIGTTILSLSFLVVLLLLLSIRPQGHLTPPDRTIFVQTISEAAHTLEVAEVLDEDLARISIERAMELVVERGVEAPFTAAVPRP